MLCLMLAGLAGLRGPSPTRAAGTVDAASTCQQPGYLGLHTSSGCVTLNNLALPGADASLGTMTLSGSFSFSPINSCGIFLVSSPSCGTTTGGGTYTITGGTFNGGTSGTFTMSGTVIGLLFQDASDNYAPCPQAAGRLFIAVPVTFTDALTGQQDTSHDIVITVTHRWSNSNYAQVYLPYEPADYSHAYSPPTRAITVTC
jgi:hypothetical protein